MYVGRGQRSRVRMFSFITLPSAMFFLAVIPTFSWQFLIVSGSCETSACLPDHVTFLSKREPLTTRDGKRAEGGLGNPYQDPVA